MKVKSQDHDTERPHMAAEVISSAFEGSCDYCGRGNVYAKTHPYALASTRSLLKVDSLNGNIRIRIRMCRPCLEEMRILLAQPFTGLEDIDAPTQDR